MNWQDLWERYWPLIMCSMVTAPLALLWGIGGQRRRVQKSPPENVSKTEKALELFHQLDWRLKLELSNLNNPTDANQVLACVLSCLDLLGARFSEGEEPQILIQAAGQSILFEFQIWDRRSGWSRIAGKVLVLDKGLYLLCLASLAVRETEPFAIASNPILGIQLQGTVTQWQEAVQVAQATEMTVA